MRLAELAEIEGVRAVHGDAEVRRVTVDSREAGTGSLFFAMPGTQRDGHEFVSKALQAGAAVAVSMPDVFEVSSPALLVDDTVEACWRVCKAVYGDPSRSLLVIGITGTNGKTTVAWVLTQALENLGHRTAYLGTLGGWLLGERIDTGLTTPFSPQLNEFFALCRDRGVEYVVMEVSSHALQQKRVDGIEFDVAVFTNLSQDHLDFHADLDEYFAAKKRLFRGLPTTKRLTSVVNLDDEYGRMLAGELSQTIAFGHGGDVECIEADSFLDRFEMRLRARGQVVDLRVPLGARFNLSNAMAVMSALLALDVSPSDAVRSMQNVRAAPGRFESVATGRDFTVIVDYAHTPDALEKVLQSAKELTPGRLICVFGCGGDRDRSKRPRMAAAASAIADVVWVTSDNPRTEDPNAIIADILPGLSSDVLHRVEADRRAAIHGAIGEATSGDCVVIAGKGHEDYQILGRDKVHFDDREVAAEALV